MKEERCPCGQCPKCLKRAYDREWREKRRNAGRKTHTEHLRRYGLGKRRRVEPVEAAEHIRAVFRECPGRDKPHLLARIKILVREWDQVWGGFKFDDGDKLK